MIAEQTDPGRDLIEVASLEDGTRRRLLGEDQVIYDEQCDGDVDIDDHQHYNDHHHGHLHDHHHGHQHYNVHHLT